MEKPTDCAWKDACNCYIIKDIYCGCCKYYYLVDSSYGWCKALPTFQLVPWCRDACSLFRRKTT